MEVNEYVVCVTDILKRKVFDIFVFTTSILYWEEEGSNECCK